MEHETAQAVTADRLTPSQIAALDVLLKGGNVTQAGKAAGRRREQVSRWIHKPGAFREVYWQERERMLQRVRDNIDSIHTHAAEAAMAAHDKGDRCRENNLRGSLEMVGWALEQTFTNL